LIALLVAAAAAISLVENAFPPLIPVAPGAKLGLSNVAPLAALVLLGVPDAFAVMLIKCLLGAALSGGLSGLMYSVPAGLAALCVEVLLFKLAFGKTSLAMISLMGATVFNAVQWLAAVVITGVNLMALLPPLLFAGVLAGAFTGLLTYYIINKLPYSVFRSGRRSEYEFQ